MMFATTVSAGIIVVIVTVLLAGRRFHGEEQARQVRDARTAIRRMVSGWQADVLLFVEGLRDLPLVTDEDLEKYRLCSAVVESSRSLGFLERRAAWRACRILFGKEVLELATSVPFEAFEGVPSFGLAAAMFERGARGEGGSRNLEMGHFGELLHRRRIAVREGDVGVLGVPKPRGQYVARNLLYVLTALGNIRGYHLIVLSRPYQLLKLRIIRLVVQLREFSSRNRRLTSD